MQRLAFLFLLLLLLCVSDISVQNPYERTFSEEMSLNLPLNAIELADATEMCKPTGVETVTFTDGKTEPAPQKKKVATKVAKKKVVKKAQPKKA